MTPRQLIEQAHTTACRLADEADRDRRRLFGRGRAYRVLLLDTGMALIKLALALETARREIEQPQFGWLDLWKNEQRMRLAAERQLRAAGIEPEAPPPDE